MPHERYHQHGEQHVFNVRNGQIRVYPGADGGLVIEAAGANGSGQLKIEPAGVNIVVVGIEGGK